MKLDGEFTFQGPRDQVWELLQDPDVLGKALPGAQKLEKTGEDEYEGKIEIKIGPVQDVFTSKVRLSDKEPPVRYTMHVEGQGRPGFTKGITYVELVEQAPNVTLMTYEANLQIGGRIASIGQRLVSTVAKTLTKHSLKNMNEALQDRLDERNASSDD